MVARPQRTASSQWITGTAARQRVHEQRAASDAILTATGTVLADDPSLTARGDAGELMPHQPIPVVVGERAIPDDAALRRHPAGLIETRTRDLEKVLSDLGERGIQRVFVEAGPALVTALVGAGLADEYSVYLAPTLLGGDRLAIGELGIPTIAGARRLRIDSVEQLGDDLLITATAHAPRLAAGREGDGLMFTGIIEERGEVLAWDRSGDAARITVKAPIAVSDAKHGDSISVGGVCLTVVDQGPDWFTADVMGVTIAMSTLGEVAVGDRVNLERAAALGDRIGGHIVQGHIDGTSEVLSVTPGRRLARPALLARPRARPARRPQGLDRRGRREPHRQRRRRRLVRGVADPRDPDRHHPRRTRRRRPRQHRDRHPGAPCPANAGR